MSDTLIDEIRRGFALPCPNQNAAKQRVYARDSPIDYSVAFGSGVGCMPRSGVIHFPQTPLYHTKDVILLCPIRGSSQRSPKDMKCSGYYTLPCYALTNPVASCSLLEAPLNCLLSALRASNEH